MTTETPPEDWVLLEAAERSGWDTTLHRAKWLREYYYSGRSYRALCDMIEKYEKPPVDRKARYFNRYLTDAEVDEQVAQMRSEK
jgi:hypothetical protein